MVPGVFKIVTKSLKYYKTPVLYQILIIALLSAIITGSLLTGKSVRKSLEKSSSEHLGNTGILVSSGVRYFDASLADRFKDRTKINCAGVLEISGSCLGMMSQKGAFKTHIYGITNEFFKFHKSATIIRPGEIAVNRKLADYLGLKPGDEIIIRFNQISDIPADSPFAPSQESVKSLVMKLGSIIETINTGNFSLSISQIEPNNIFINLSDLEDVRSKPAKINRLIIEGFNEISENEVYTELKQILRLSDIGLSIRYLKSTGGTELISDRVFIDEAIVREIKNTITSSAPVITYLGNRFKTLKRSTPYSFVSALPTSLYPEIDSGNGIIVNKWLADDLEITVGDSIEMFWYSPDSLNKLKERSKFFNVKKIVEMQGIWSDSLLMPDFPGISGRESCSDWDAGVPIKMIDIRRKDEDYWNKFKGTPKAFINYDKGIELWGNNFGPATSIRFRTGLSETEIERKLDGALEPDRLGFIVTDISGESIKAANESVDFSTLFLSLGFFLILASMLLLSLSVSSFFDLKRGQISTLYILGFNNNFIERLIFIESAFISLIGSLLGAFAGYLVNILITVALNSVWRGAVQTNTLQSFFNLMPVVIGFVSTIIVAMAIMMLKIKIYLKRLHKKEKENHANTSIQRNLLFMLGAFFIAIVLFIYSIFYNKLESILSFAAGTVLLLSLLLLWRQYFIGWKSRRNSCINTSGKLSASYYSFNPSHAITPILFIASGIFTVFITGANKIDFSENHLTRSDGTGGYLLWCENTISVKEDLTTEHGKKSLGLDSDELREMSIVQAKMSSGDDASCLNLNHVSVPPLLGINPSDFISKGAFSFSERLSDRNTDNPWKYLNISSKGNTIYGIADQTVLEWGLKISPGDTLVLKTENGQPLNIIIAAGLKSSVFQGFVLIGSDNFSKYYPSVSGSSILLIDGKRELTDNYKNLLYERFENNGINIVKTTDRLTSFNEVTNTYLSVFGIFGAFGMITGVAGLGFVLLRNYNSRKREFALLLSMGFEINYIRKMIVSEQVLILFAGVSTGVLSAIFATLPSLISTTDIPWTFLILMIFAIILSGLSALFLSVRAVTKNSLTACLKKE
jgi:putative ABC transport system permease protein